MGAKGNYSFCFEVERCLRIFGKWGYVSLQSLSDCRLSRWGTITFIFCDNCVHQGSALIPLLLIMVVDVLTEDVRDGSLMVLLYAGDLGNH